MTITDTQLTDETVSQLMKLIDTFLSDISHVGLVEQSKVLDFILDMRNVISSNYETTTS